MADDKLKTASIKNIQSAGQESQTNERNAANGIEELVLEPTNPSINRRYERDVDKGWAWVVLVAVFMTFFTVQGISLTANIYFLIYLEAFQQSRGVTALVYSVFTAVMNFSGPLSSFLLVKYGPKALLMIGGLLITAGMGCVFFAHSIIETIIYAGCIRGLGAGLARVGCAAALAKYFRKRLYMANGIMYSAGSIGLMFVGLVAEFTIDFYGWRGAMLILAGFAAQIIVYGALVFNLPQEPLPVDDPATTSAAKSATVRQYLADTRFWMVTISSTCLIMFSATVIVYWKDMMLVKEYFKVGVVSMGVGSTVGRTVAGCLSSKLSPPVYLAVSNVFCAISVMGFLIADEMWIVAVHNLVWGYLHGQLIVLDRVQLIWVFGRKESPVVLGYTMFFMAVGSAASIPIAGILTDWTENYLATLLLTAAYLIISACASIYLFFNNRKRNSEIL